MSADINPSFRSKYGPWAVVTGASSGIGATFARLLAQRNLDVVLIARRQSRLRELADALAAAHGVRTLVVQADLSTPEGLDAVTLALEPLDVGLLVNNAGIESHGRFWETERDTTDRLVLVNALACTQLFRVVLRKMIESGRGRKGGGGAGGGGVIFVSSMAGWGMPWLSLYSASKAFVSTLALNVRAELQVSGIDVDVLALEPGFVDTDMISGTADGSSTGTPGISVPREAIISAERCVEEGLWALGRRARYTPGWMNRVMLALSALLPTTLALYIMARTMARVVNLPPLS